MSAILLPILTLAFNIDTSYFLVFAQESIKEGAIGEALYAELPLVKSALSYVPLPAALGFRWSNLTSILCRGKMSRFFLGSKLRFKIEMRYRGIVSARLGILKGWLWRAGARHSIAP